MTTDTAVLEFETSMAGQARQRRRHHRRQPATDGSSSSRHPATLLPRARGRRSRPTHGRLMTDLQLDVYTSPMRDLSNGGQFSPTTATLVLGPTEAVLVDTQYMESDVAELARRIATSGRTLTAIYVTHAHADHYFGLERLLDQFPQARPLALPAVAADIAAGNETARSSGPSGSAATRSTTPSSRNHSRATPSPSTANRCAPSTSGRPTSRTTPCSTSPRSTPSSPATSSTTASTRSSPLRARGVAIVDRQRRQGRRPQTSHRHRRAQTTRTP